MLDHLQSSGQVAANALNTLNCGSIPYTLASFCVIKQSWRCFAKYVERFGLTHLHTTLPTLSGFDEATKSKTARQYAVECDLLEEYERIVGYYYSRQGAGDSNNVVQTKRQIDKILTEIEAKKATRRTLVITDYRCIEHADFPHKRNIKEKALQRDR